MSAEPYPFRHVDLLTPPVELARLRVERPVAPVPTRAPGGREETAWLVTRHADVRAGLTDPRLVRGPHGFGGADPADHDRYRGIVARAFGVRHVAGLRPAVERLTDEVLDGLAVAGPPADLVAGLCFPLHIGVIAELVGVAGHGERFPRWAAVFRDLRRLPGPGVHELHREIEELLRGQVDDTRLRPGDDLLSRLVRVHDADSAALTADEVVRLSKQLLMAGYESTANGLAMGLFALLAHPDQLALLRADPDLTGRAVEEMLRYAPSLGTHGLVRHATQEVELAGVRIPRGATVILLVWSANRDEDAYPRAGCFDVTRRPRHGALTFGLGRHFCVGAALARMELEIAVRALVKRFPALRPAEPFTGVSWRVDHTVAGPDRLPVTW